jgi:hypothetical protein
MHGPTTPFGLIYGNSGLGKTTALLYAFPHGRFIAPPRCLDPARTVCGIALRKDQVFESVRTIMDVLRVMRQRDSRPLIVDDLSIICEQTVKAIPSEANRYAKWEQIFSLIMEIRELALYRETPVFLSAHQREPHVNDAGTREIGGIDLQGKGRARLPAACNLVIHVVPGCRPHKGSWQTVCRVRPGSQDHMSSKDRYNILRDGTPFNLGEILRIAGLEIPRIPAVDSWADLIEAAAGLYVESPKSLPDILRNVHTTLGEESRFVRSWVIQDFIDRAEILMKLDPRLCGPR